MSDERRVRLIDIHQVPGMRKNMISLGMLDSRGCGFSMCDGVLNASKRDDPGLQGEELVNCTGWKGVF